MIFFFFFFLSSFRFTEESRTYRALPYTSAPTPTQPPPRSACPSRWHICYSWWACAGTLSPPRLPSSHQGSLWLLGILGSGQTAPHRVGHGRGDLALMHSSLQSHTECFHCPKNPQRPSFILTPQSAPPLCQLLMFLTICKFGLFQSVLLCVCVCVCVRARA